MNIDPDTENTERKIITPELMYLLKVATTNFTGAYLMSLKFHVFFLQFITKI